MARPLRGGKGQGRAIRNGLFGLLYVMSLFSVLSKYEQIMHVLNPFLFIMIQHLTFFRRVRGRGLLIFWKLIFFYLIRQQKQNVFTSVYIYFCTITNKL